MNPFRPRRWVGVVLICARDARGSDETTDNGALASEAVA